MSDQIDKKPPSANSAATTYLAVGAGIGVFGACSAIVTGVVCPLCVIAAPALIGIGAYQRWNGARPKECKGIDSELKKSDAEDRNEH